MSAGVTPSHIVNNFMSICIIIYIYIDYIYIHGTVTPWTPLVAVYMVLPYLQVFYIVCLPYLHMYNTMINSVYGYTIHILHILDTGMSQSKPIIENITRSAVSEITFALIILPFVQGDE